MATAVAEAWKLQISVKNSAGDLLNVRGDTVDELKDTYDELFGEGSADIALVAFDGDAAEPEEKPARKSSSRNKPEAKSTSRRSSSKDPGDFTFKGGIFKGATIEEVFNLDASDAKKEYGYSRGDGAGYIEWLSEEGNPPDAKKAAASFLEDQD